MVPAGIVDASPEYKNLLDPILAAATGREPQQRTTRCPGSRANQSSDSSSFRLLDSLATRIPVVKSIWQSLAKNKVLEQPPLHRSAQIFQNEMLKIAPFADMDAAALSQATVAIVLPGWLAGTKEACHFLEAARGSFGRIRRLENPPSAAYSAAGYELCRISYDAFYCTGPGRIMTLEHDGDLSVATITGTPLLNWAADPVVFSVRRGLGAEKMTQWLDSFVRSQKPDKVILSGTGVDQPSFMDVLQISSIKEYLEDQPPVSARHILAFGAAQVAKDSLESQPDDCSESRECDELRRKADAMAGPFRPPVPPIWPSVGPRHDEL